jgi:hypothetical protein
MGIFAQLTDQVLRVVFDKIRRKAVDAVEKEEDKRAAEKAQKKNAKADEVSDAKNQKKKTKQ